MACSQSKLFDIFFLNGQIDRFDVEPAPSFVLCKRDIKEMIKRLQDMTDAECPLPVCGRPLPDKGKRCDRCCADGYCERQVMGWTGCFPH